MDVTDLVWIDETGYNFEDYPSFLSWLQGEYQNIYGADVYLGADSQDGQFLAIIAQALYDTAALGSAVYNSFSPVTAQGVGLSRNVKINGLEREIPTFSFVTLTIIGVAGTIITNGIAQDILSQQWALPSTVTIPGGGSIDVTATSTVVGDITAEPDTITTIFTPTLGWQSVNNSGSATAGAPVESDAALRVRQSISTSLPAQTVFDATLGAVGNVSGVTAVQGYENYTSTIGGGNSGSEDQPAHSINIVVTGGDSTEICQTICDYKTPGTQTWAGDTGAVTEIVYDAKGMPVSISYQPSIATTIGVEIVLTTLQGWTTDYIPLIQDAVAAVISATPIGGGPAQAVLLNSLFAPIYNACPVGVLEVTSIELNINGGGFSAANADLEYDWQAQCSPTTNVSVTT